MRTALITSGDKQQVVLQPENTREHRILQMLLDGMKEVTVKESNVSVDKYGNIAVTEERSQFYDPERTHPKPVMVQVQPAAPVVKEDPNLMHLDQGQLREVFSMMLHLLAASNQQDGVLQPDAWKSPDALTLTFMGCYRDLNARIAGRI